MTVKNTNRYLFQTLLVTMFFLLGPLSSLSSLPFGISKIAEYTTSAALGFLFLKKTGISFKEALPYHVPMKAETALWAVVAAFLIQPIMTVLAELGGMVFGDVYTAVMGLAQEATKERGLLETLFTTAVIPAVYEEIFFRGFFYAGYKKGRGVCAAILLTSLLFGMFHMIAQQALCTMVAGFVLAVFRELSGSMWPGMLLHFLNNSMGKIGNAIAELNPACAKFMPGNWFTLEDTTHTIVTIVAAVAAVPLFYLLLRRVARVEGKEEEWKTLFKSRKNSEENSEEKPEKILTPALVWTLIIEGGFMFVAFAIVEIMKRLG